MSITLNNNYEAVRGLFSSMSSNSSGIFSSSDMLGINYADYASIRSGSYHKLLSAYYALDDTEETKGSTNQSKLEEITNQNSSKYTSTSTAKDKAETLTNIMSDAEKLSDAADTLLDKGTKSVFNKKTVTDEKTGTTTTDYDKNAIYDAVKKFADSYNAVVASAGEAKTNSIHNAASNMVSATKVNAKMLESVGITIDSEKNTLSVDKDKFQKADMNTVKSMFNGNGSYAYQVAVKASMIDYQAQYEANKANTYTSSGNYSNAYTAGSTWDSWM